MNKSTFHILVVDDDDRIRELVKEYLVENNFLVTTAILTGLNLLSGYSRLH